MRTTADSAAPREPYTDEEVRRYAAAWLFLCSRGYHPLPHWMGEVVRFKDADRANRIASGEDELPERIAARLAREVPV
jgi:hypothetical protein